MNDNHSELFSPLTFDKCELNFYKLLEDMKVVSALFQFFTVNTLLSKVQIINKFIYQKNQEYLGLEPSAEVTELRATIHLEKIENLQRRWRKNGAGRVTVDNLVDWNQRMIDLIRFNSSRLTHLEILQHDYKVFHPLSDRLIN